MQSILLFLYRIRVFLIFVFLETIAVYLIVSNNSQQGSVFFNSSNRLSGNILNTQNNIIEYFSLSSVNKSLVEKNAELLSELENYRQRNESNFIEIDSSFVTGFQFKGAKVINNSINLSQNFITLNKGSKDGIKEGMGVFNEEGVVGRIKGVTANYSSVISLLHIELLVSSKIVSNEVFGSTKWDGRDPKFAKLLYVPRHVVVKEGDQVVTSGYNAIFPEGIPIGTIVEVKPGLETNYLDITIELATDFTRLSYVYLVENEQTEEINLLNQSKESVDE
ncbi:rod shape-determining protein MreC [Cyclobacteriaceae bacterium YHN15]|nr:rod shape-determining protein MreC [Cyclobacteriaceae bacterium YHN15]